ncbi:MAG: FtsW/RodA/SpoVE family cell cycle protein [Candidatus Caldarchaeum sp.]
MAKRLAQALAGGDVWLLGLLGIALGLSSFVVFDAGFAQGNDVLGNLWRHGISIIGFLIILWTMGKIPKKYQALFVLTLYSFTWLLLLLVVIPGVGVEVNGARRWLALGSFRFQPSEMLKPATILFISYVLTLKLPPLHLAPRNRLAQADRWFTPLVLRGLPAILVVSSLVLVEAQPDLGTAAILGLTALSVMLLGGVRWKLLLSICVAGILATCLYVGLREYRWERVVSHFERWHPANVRGVAFQPNTSETAMALGGVMGVGIGEGKAKHVLPAATTDYVFITIAEETGIWGALLVLTLLGALSFRLLWHAAGQRDAFVRCVVGGVGCWVGIQSILNLLMAGSLLFSVGIPLPFFSYGGSSLLGLGVGFGAVNWLLRNQRARGDK